MSVQPKTINPDNSAMENNTCPMNPPMSPPTQPMPTETRMRGMSRTMEPELFHSPSTMLGAKATMTPNVIAWNMALSSGISGGRTAWRGPSRRGPPSRRTGRSSR